jgi:hypothetical protein
LTEIAKVRITADKLAKGESVEGGDTERVLAGLVAQLAAQVERLSGSQPARDPAADANVTPSKASETKQAVHEAEMRAEEDRSPEHSPADPLIQR